MAAAAKKLRVRQVRSAITRPPSTQKVLKGLGLRGPHSEVVVDNTPSFRGMVKKVLHLVSVEETSG
ncbi:MAG: 50S ribosomal protein L30 [Deltaproteobacteria bacterium]|nr:50S ribosomal protein L30 [Deltaproteobacteria bacterium]